MIDEALASLPALLKNEPAQNLEMKDFSPAVGTMPLIRPTGLRHCPLAACRQATSTPDHAEARFDTASGNRMRLLRRQGGMRRR